MNQEIRKRYKEFYNKPFAMTVKGPIDPEDLGMTLIHEHTIADYTIRDEKKLEYGQLPIGESLWPMERVLECYGEAEKTGIHTVIDAVPGNIVASAHPLFMALLAEKTNLNVIQPIGFYTVDQMAGPNWAMPPATVEGVAERLKNLMKYGIGYTGVKPGFIKMGCGPHLNDVERFWLAALVEVQKETGAYIYVHTQETQDAETVVDAFVQAGADMSKCEIGHVGWGVYDNAKERHLEMLKSGINLGFDNIGMNHRPVADYVDLVYDMIEAGYANRILMSHDAIPVTFGWGTAWGMGPEFYHGNNTVVQRRIIPALLERGVKQEDIDTIMIDNPKRLLTFDPVKYPALIDTLLWLRPENDEWVGGDWSGQTGHRVGIDSFYDPK